jgi:nucleoid DNA-binding protein
MDIDLLSKMVKELILDNDRVALPGLGSFVAELVPSTFSDKGYTINPPYRRLYFRSKPDEGRELAEFYATTNKVEEDMAERIIKDFVSELKSILHTKKTVVFPGLGRLRATKENNLFFVADEDLDIYPAGFGLEPISLKTHQETREEVSAALTDLKLILEEPKAEPEPLPEPSPAPLTEPSSEPALVSETPEVQETADFEAPEPKTVNVQTPESVGVQMTEPEPAEVSVSISEPIKPKRKTILILSICLVALVIVLLIAFAVVGRLCPDWIDQFLYSPEELKILNYPL